MRLQHGGRKPVETSGVYFSLFQALCQCGRLKKRATSGVWQRKRGRPLPPSPFHSRIPLAADPAFARLLFRSFSLTESLEQAKFTLALSKRFFSLLNLKIFAKALLSTYWLLRTRKHKTNGHFRARNMLQGTMLMSRIVKKLSVIFSEQSGLPS